MTNKAGTRERSAVGGTQVSPLNFGIEFLLEDPQDIRSMKSRIVFPESSGQKPTKESVDEDGEENGEVEESFDVRVLKFRKKELEDEIREIEKLEKARKVQNGDGNDEKRPLKRSPPKRKPRPDDDDEDSDSDTDASEETEEEDSEDSEDPKEDSDSDDDDDEDDDEDERRKIFQCIQRNEIPRGRVTQRRG